MRTHGQTEENDTHWGLSEGAEWEDREDQEKKKKKRNVKIQNTNTTKCWLGCGATGTLLHH